MIQNRGGDIDELYVEDRTSTVSNSVDDPSGICVTDDNAVLEINIKDPVQSGDEIRQAVQNTIDTRLAEKGNLGIRGVRPVVDGNP